MIAAGHHCLVSANCVLSASLSAGCEQPLVIWTVCQPWTAFCEPVMKTGGQNTYRLLENKCRLRPGSKNAIRGRTAFLSHATNSIFSAGLTDSIFCPQTADSTFANGHEHELPATEHD